MNSFYEPVINMAGMDDVRSVLKNTCKTVMLSGCIDSQKSHLAECLGDDYKFTVIITSDENKARQMQEDCMFFNKNSIFYPAKDFIFYSADVHGNQIAGQRISCIDKIITAREDKNKKLTVVTTIDGCSDFLISLDKYRQSIIEFKQDDIIDVEKLSKELVTIGYERSGLVDERGKFAIRGGIIDIFSFTDEVPVRIELWDDEIDSIRSFDVESQRSIEKLKSYRVFPATECILSEEELDNGLEKIKTEYENQLEILGINKKKKTKEDIERTNRLRRMYSDFQRNVDYSKFLKYFDDNLCGFLDYFPVDDTLFVLDEPNRVSERMGLIDFEYEDSTKNRLEGGYILPGQTGMLKSLSDIYSILGKSRLAVLSSLDYKPKEFHIDNYTRIDAKSISSYNNSFELLCEDLKKYKKNKYKIIVICNSRTRASRIVDDLSYLGITAYFSEDFTKSVVEGTIMVTYGNIHKGFEYPLSRFVIIAENDIFTKREKKRANTKKKYSGKNIAGFNELGIGDYVVHEDYGLGVYNGIEKIEVDGVEKDYIKISYANNSCLYVLATQLDRIQKYANADIEKKPKLNKIGGKEWGKTKSKVHNAVEEVAKDLVELYAIRQHQQGFKFGPDTVWQREFEEMFPYEETKDQMTAIEDTKKDMESSRVMDRLICGDVGYGKTEIAIRAAFKAVQEDKQVAYLCPTTILAQQIYNTFKSRMKDFPVRIAELSSFRTAKEMKESVKDLKKGLVDIVIGTHRILSKDVEFKNLGLLIIDEEQRFGVAHKEKIKKLKNDIDVLTLSATPIPRTLHMSLVGIRDMSVLEEPPVDRVPIQTFVTEQNDEMIREAINRELARNGQVFYVYNRVRNIEDVAAHISELVPNANVEYAHGQMDKRQLEKIMYEFINGEIDVLISTTIIETGVDISNVNTMIVEDADKFGLSQLYQLRGRVGRSSRTAYAFLLYRRDRMLTEVAQKRLSAIREFSDLGSGFKIAMKDLEIRGAGNVLGKSQHGHMAAVGYDLYCKMLNQAVNNLKGIKNEYEFETTVDIGVDAFIPASYIKSEYQKLDVYKRVAAIETEEELSDMKDELGDRYGSIPSSALNLMDIAFIRSMAHKIGIIEIKGGVSDNLLENGFDQTKSGGAVSSNAWITNMKIYPKADISIEKIEQFVNEYGGALRFVPDVEPKLIWRVTRKKFSNASEYLKGLKGIISEMVKKF